MTARTNPRVSSCFISFLFCMWVFRNACQARKKKSQSLKKKITGHCLVRRLVIKCQAYYNPFTHPARWHSTANDLEAYRQGCQSTLNGYCRCAASGNHYQTLGFKPYGPLTCTGVMASVLCAITEHERDVSHSPRTTLLMLIESKGKRCKKGTWVVWQKAFQKALYTPYI